MKPCTTTNYTTGEKCGNSSCNPEIIEKFLVDKIKKEVKGAVIDYNKTKSRNLDNNSILKKIKITKEKTIKIRKTNR